MNVTKKIIFAFLACYLITIASQAQTSFNVYPVNGVFGVKFFSEKKISIEPRLDFQFDHANSESNVFINTEIFTLLNFYREDRFNLYTGIALGGNFYNQAQSNFSGSIPFGASYYVNDSKRIAIIAECGAKITAADFLKIKSYALAGLQIRLKKKN